MRPICTADVVCPLHRTRSGEHPYLLLLPGHRRFLGQTRLMAGADSDPREFRKSSIVPRSNSCWKLSCHTAGNRDRAIWNCSTRRGSGSANWWPLISETFSRGAAVAGAGKGRKERLVPFGRQARDALSRYLPVRARGGRSRTNDEALFVNQRGGRLTDRSVRRILDARSLEPPISTTFTRTPSGTPSRPTCSRPGWTCA